MSQQALSTRSSAKVSSTPNVKPSIVSSPSGWTALPISLPCSLSAYYVHRKNDHHQQQPSPLPQTTANTTNNNDNDDNINNNPTKSTATHTKYERSVRKMFEVWYLSKHKTKHKLVRPRVVHPLIVRPGRARRHELRGPNSDTKSDASDSDC
jgi:hypothetical protein